MTEPCYSPAASWNLVESGFLEPWAELRGLGGELGTVGLPAAATPW